jgi:hypothetical protein
MLHSAQRLTLRQAAPTWEATQVIRGLTQGQALQNLRLRNISEVCYFERIL